MSSWPWKPRPIPPPTPEPPAPQDTRIHCTVTGHITDPPTLTIDTGTVILGVFGENPQRATFTIPPTEPGGFGATFHYGTGILRYVTPTSPGDYEGPELAYRTLLGPLTIERQWFMASGQRWTGIESSEFPLYVRWLQGDDVVPVLQQRQSLGFNLYRVWLLNTSVYRIIPADHPDFYARLADFVDLCAGFGAYVDFTCFTQAESLMPDKAQQQRHLDLIGAGLERVKDRVLLSLVNEADQHDNATVDGLRLPAGFLWSQGSNGADATPPGPIRQWTEYHSNGLPEWWRKTGHNSMEYAVMYGVPCLGGENTRMPDQDDNPQHAYDAAAAAALLCAGSCFHSVNGKRSLPWSGRELECATAWANGAKSVPLEFQRGQYLRLANPSSDVLRVYRRVLADGRYHEVQVRA